MWMGRRNSRYYVKLRRRGGVTEAACAVQGRDNRGGEGFPGCGKSREWMFRASEGPAKRVDSGRVPTKWCTARPGSVELAGVEIESTCQCFVKSWCPVCM